MPEPDGPRKLTNSPDAISRSSGQSASSAPKRLAIRERRPRSRRPPQASRPTAEPKTARMIMIVAATATISVYSTRTSSQMRTGSVLTSGPARKTASTTSSNEVTKAKTPPPNMPGRIDGKVTVRNTRHGPAPSPLAARARRGSTPRPRRRHSGRHRAAPASYARARGRACFPPDRPCGRARRGRPRARSPARPSAEEQAGGERPSGVPVS